LTAGRGLAIKTVHLIKKDQNGSVTEERTDDDFPPPSGTLAGMALGALIGMLGGNVPAAAAAGVSAMIGLLRDLRESESHTDFIAEFSNALLCGKYAVLADAQEDQAAPVDVRMRELGGVVIRMKRSTAIRKHTARQAAQFGRELDTVIANLGRTEGSIQERLQDALDRGRAHLKQKVQDHQARSA